MSKILNHIKFVFLKNWSKSKLILASIIVVSFIIRILWLFTPVVRDEGAVGYVAMVWAKGILPYQAPMAGVNPPLVYIMYLIPSVFFGNNIIPIRILNDALFMVSIIAIYLIAKDWFGQRTALLSATLYGIFMSAPIFETHLAIPSSLALPFAVLSVYSLNFWFKNRKKSLLFAAGFLMSFATLILQYYVLGIAFLLISIVWVVYAEYRGDRQSLKHFTKTGFSAVMIVTIGFTVMFVIVSVYFAFAGLFDSFFQATVTRFLGSSSYISQPEVYFSMKFLVIAEALPLWIFSIVGCVFCLLKRSKYDLVLIMWVALMLFIAIPPPHFGRHFAQIIPPLSILSGIAIATLLQNIKLRSLRILGNIKENAAIVFLIVILVLTMVPVIQYQSIQYPNTNYTLFGESWSYTFSNNWTQQQDLVSFINTNALNQSIFIHGWEAELYWLTSHLAPGIRWASSYVNQMPDITNKDYQDILQEVNNGTFRYVILMTGFQPDQIIKAVAEQYFYVKNIGPYAIYDKYDSQDKIFYSFVTDFNQSHQQYWLQNGSYVNFKNLDESIFNAGVSQLSVDNKTALAIEQIPPGYIYQQRANSSLIFDEVNVPVNSSLSFGVTLLQETWAKPTDGVIFEILVKENNSMQSIYYQYINPANNTGNQRLYQYKLDLSQFWGKTVTFYFVTNSGTKGDFTYDWAYWWNPQLLNKI